MQYLDWIRDRMREPSTMAGLAILLNAAQQMWPEHAQIFLGLMTIFGLGATVKKDPAAPAK